MRALAATVYFLTFATGLPAGVDEGSFEKSLSVSGPVDLDIKTDSGGIAVRQGSSGTVRIHAIVKADNSWFGSGDVRARIQELERNPPVEQNGNRVRIGYVRGDLLRNISMRLEIEAPSNTQLRARADSGGIHVEGIRGPVDCKTDSGGIQIRDIAADVHATADSGGIHVSNVQGKLFAHVDSGGIEASGISGSIDAQTESGSLRLQQTSAAPITAKAESGGVVVTLAPGAGYDLSAEADSGRVSVPEMAVRSVYSPQHVEGKIRGGGPLVKIHADSGNVSID